MKLLIDVDEKLVCKGFDQPLTEEERDILIRAIGNSTPYEERPQGEWIYGEDDCGQDGWFCSECNFFVPWYYQYYEKDVDFIRDYKVCPHCKAEMVTYTGKDRDMRGEENDSQN